MSNADNYEAAIVFSKIADLNNEYKFKSIALDFLQLLFLRGKLTKIKLDKREFEILRNESRWIEMNKHLS